MDIMISKSDWDSLDDETRKRITAVIGGYFKGSRIIPDPKGASIKSMQIPLSNPFCEAACNIAEEAAKAACFNLGNPIAIAICIAAAEAAGRECRSRC